MDKPLQLIQHLYGEREAAPWAEDDEALQQEYDDLRAVKDVLDRRDPVSPDAEVVDQIVDAAGAAHRPDTPSDRDAERGTERDDRAARRSPGRGTARLLRRAGAVLAVVLLAGVGWWQLGAPGGEASRSAPPVAASAESEASSAARAPSADVAPQARGQVTTSASDLPDWDEGDDVVRLHRRIEILNARSTASRWGSGSLLQTTGQQRP